MINSFQTLTLNRRQPKRQTLFGETGGSQTSTKNKVLGGTGLSMAAAALLQVISPSVASAEALPADTESTLDQFQASSNNANYRETIRDIAFSLFNQQAPFDANVGNFHVQEGQYLEHIAAAVISINPDYNISELHDLVQAISTHNELGNPDVLRTNANNGVLNLTPFLTSAAVANNAQDQEYSGPVKTIEIARAGDQLPWDVAVDIADDYSMPLDDVFAIITALNPDLIERSNNGQLGVDEAYTIQVPDYQELTIETINTSGVYPWHVAERIAENQDRDLGDVLDAIEALNEEVFNQANAGTLSAPYNLVLPNDFIDVAVPDDVVEYQPGAGVTLSDVAEVASRNDNALSYQEALEIIKTLNPNEFANATRLPADYTILIPATFIVDADMTSESPVTNDSSHYGDLVEHQPGLGVTLSEVADRAAANNDELSYSQALDIIEELNPEAFANARRLPANYSITIPSSFLENSVLNNVGTSRLLEAPLYGSLEVASLSPDEAGVASNDLNEQLETVTASINELEEIVTTSEEAIPVAEQTLNEAEAALAVVEPELLEDIDTKEEEIADTEAEITEIRGGSEPISESVEFGLPLAGGFELFDLAGTVGEFGDRPNQNETGYIPGATDPHTGWDFGLPTGTPIQAVLDGTVIDLHRENSGRGFSITLQHANGFFSQYNHLNFNDGIYVENGDTVTAGQEIGEVGNTGVSTGPHLDLKIWGPDSDIIPDMVNRI